jgi:flagellar biogenesis protein FliO
MGSYIVHFIVYTLAMSGLIFFALFIYKKFMNGSFVAKGAKTLSIEETMNINPRKSLMIVKAGDERFLIASDTDKTSLIAKLGEVKIKNSVETPTVTNGDKNDIERFKDIIKIAKQEKIDNIDISDFIPPKNKPANVTNINRAAKKSNHSDEKNQVKEPIHLEVITDINPSIPARNKRKTKYTSKNHGKKVNIDVGEIKNHGFSTMKEMAAKVYEL